jgi:predicted nucleotidyltransferase
MGRVREIAAGIVRTGMKAASFETIVRTLQEAKVRYLVVGGIAVIAHGYVRLTVDVDLLIELEPSNVVAALRALERLGYEPTIPVTAEQFADAALRARWIREKPMEVLKLYSQAHRETTIDVFVSDPLGFEEAYARVVWEKLADGLNVPVCSYPDLVRLKLLASRPQDLLDVQQLKKVRGEP